MAKPRTARLVAIMKCFCKRGAMQLFASRIAVALCLGLVTGCGPTRLAAVPSAEEEDPIAVDGMSGIRFWGDESSPEMIRVAIDSYGREVAARAAGGQPGALPPANFLAISGGGENGAFGAGLLVGWTAAGNRPSFKTVTGISTGALIAPFAFLGPEYDDQLRAAYTTMSSRDVLESRFITAVIWDDAMADNAPLQKTVARMVDQRLLDAIAREYEKGRILLIGTTNLDVGRPVIWDIGRLATSNNPNALDLFRKILVASAAIPGAFPPTMINVVVDGKPYQEMHVDGGTTSQVFVYPPNLNTAALMRANNVRRERHMYVIRNARLDPDWAQVDRRTLSIAEHAVSTLIQMQGVGDLYRIYLTSQRDGVDFNLAFIPRTFNVPLLEPFDTRYMAELFKVGYVLGSAGYAWSKVPPGYNAPETFSRESAQ